jgi:hypothetical protein
VRVLVEACPERLALPASRRGHATLETIATALLTARDVLATELAGFDRRLRAMARDHDDARRLASGCWCR